MLDRSDERDGRAPADTGHVYDEARGDVAAMIAHEMAASLGALRGYGAMLALSDLDAAVAARALAAIQREVELLDVLVADLQAMAVGNAPFAIRLERIAVDALVADVSAFVAALPWQHPAVVTVETRARVWADAERIGQVLRNLLTNAAKYSPPGAPIEVRVLPEGRRVRIEVIDQGVGIPAEELEFIFGKYHRGAGRAVQVSGLGLGLYVARRIVEAHGSELRVASTQGHGSVFSFELEIVP